MCVCELPWYFCVTLLLLQNSFHSDRHTYMTWQTFTLYLMLQDSFLDCLWPYKHFNLESPFVDEAWEFSLVRSPSSRLKAISTNFNRFCCLQNIREDLLQNFQFYTCKHIDPHSPLFYDDNISLKGGGKRNKQIYLEWLNSPLIK